jgi:cathepsin L
MLAAASAHTREHYEEMFIDHMKTYDLKFDSGEEFVKRLEIFIAQVDEVTEWNKNPSRTWSKGLNAFSHMTGDEWRAHMRLKPMPPRKLRKNVRVHGEPTTALGAFTTSKDWVALGAVTSVKNQGQCGGCWSFSACGSLEGARQIKYGTLESLSEQELVSCDTRDEGCDGGWMDDAFDWIKANGGIASYDAYPYTSGATGNSGTCMSNPPANLPNSAPASYVDVQAGSVSAMQSAVNIGPVSIAIQADQSTFQNYAGGIITANCGQTLDHGVLIVGYGQDNGVDYWKVKNSWGTYWGENGYVRIEASSANLCGVLLSGTYPTF